VDHLDTYQHARIPEGGEPITDGQAGSLQVPPCPIIPFIEGDGIGPDVWRATRVVLDAAVHKIYGGARSIAWMEVYAGAKAAGVTGERLPAETARALSEFRVGIKGPLATEVGAGARSLNVALRQTLDLYACVRPVRYIPGVPAPVKEPGLLDVVIFRENTEDVYAGIEWPAGSVEADRLRDVLRDQFGVAGIRERSGIGIKPMSEYGSKRLVRAAIRYAASHGRPSVTLVHKGNIMKCTEGAFRSWGYEVAREEFGDLTVTDAGTEADARGGAGRVPGKVIIKDRIADAMFQELLLHPEQHSVIATTNLNGDYLSDAAAAQVGGLGIAPGANIGDRVALFEATHGTAPGLAGQDRANPCSLILSGVMMLEHLGWGEAAGLVREALERVIAAGVVTEDLITQTCSGRAVSTSAFGEAVIAAIK
jgi:isocitrate dehydrogenase